MENFIIITVIVLIVGFAGAYVYKAKKNGKKCIGCPDGCSCSLEDRKTACNCTCSDNI